MEDISLDQIKYQKLSQLCFTIETLYHKSQKPVIKRILQNDASIINYTVPPNSLVNSHSPTWVGYSPLHFAVHWHSEVAVDLLLQHRASIIKKDNNGCSPLHLAAELKYKLKDEKQSALSVLFKQSIIDKILSSHVKNNIIDNPVNRDGLSHFHIACMANHVQAVSFFLKSGVAVDDGINLNSMYLCGYTPLHLAAKYNCVETVELLLKDGANLKEGKLRTTLYLLIDRNREIIDTLLMEGKDYGWTPPAAKKMKLENETKLITERERNEIITDLLLKIEIGNNVNISDDIGLSHFHVACSKQNKTLAESFLKNNVNINASVNMDSPIWPGFTPLHFAAHFNYETFELLIMHGADITAKDAGGVTPLDVCVSKYGFRIINFILSEQALRSNKPLHDVLFNLHYISLLENVFPQQFHVNMSIPLDSPIWPGYTLLHLFLLFSKTCKKTNKSIAEVEDEETHENRDVREFQRGNFISNKKIQWILQQGADVTAQDIHGTTPLHLAFRMENVNAVGMILSSMANKVANPVNEEGLSHFHIACIMEDTRLVRIFLEHGVGLNEPMKTSFHYRDSFRTTFYQSGSTPLHISVIQSNSEMTELLLNYGADVLAENDDGSTAIHLAAQVNRISTIHLLYKSPAAKGKNAMTKQGLTHFHVACMCRDPAIVEEFLQLEININDQISNYCCSNEYCKSENYCKNKCKFWIQYAGYTALHFAVDSECVETIKLLIAHGADIHAKDAKGMTPLHKMLINNCFNDRENPLDFIISAKNDSKPLDDTGLNQLHVACLMTKKDAIERLLKSGVDVNRSINWNSPIWPGYTPLHLTIKFAPGSKNYAKMREFIDVIEILLTNGANVAIKNTKGDTPLHLASQKGNQDAMNILLKASASVDTNPTDNHGISHFHLACKSRNFDVIEEFLKRGVNVNEAADFFSFPSRGRTPLHFAVVESCDKIVGLLLQHGANSNAEDFQGATPLHYACSHTTSPEIVEMLLSNGEANIHATNIFGTTPLEATLKNRFLARTEKMKILLNHKALVNLQNPITLETPLSLAIKEANNDIALFAEEAVDIVTATDKNGRNMLHTIVAGSTRLSHPRCNFIIVRLLDRGCDMDLQDSAGKTPLHVATEMTNVNSVDILLANGADLNIVDHDGKTAFMHSLECLSKGHHTSFEIDTYRLLARHVNKMQVAGCWISEQNNAGYTKSLRLYTFYYDDGMVRYTGELDKMRNTYLSKYTTLKDVLAKDANAMAVLIGNNTLDNVVNSIQKEISIIGSVCPIFFSHESTKNLTREFPVFGSLLKMQYRKGLMRRKLIEPAKRALELLVNLGLPDPCSECVIMYLSNTDLRVIISLIDNANSVDFSSNV